MESYKIKALHKERIDVEINQAELYSMFLDTLYDKTDIKRGSYIEDANLVVDEEYIGVRNIVTTEIIRKATKEDIKNLKLIKKVQELLDKEED